MRYFLAHLDDRPGEPWQTSDPEEEIAVIAVGEKLAVTTPVAGLRHLLPLMEEAFAQLPPACCPECGERLPARAGDP